MIDTFSKLHFDLAASQDRRDRAELMRAYFGSEPDERNRHWAKYLLSHGEQKRYIDYYGLRGCTSEYTELPLWLIEECIQHTGNVTEAVTLLVKSTGSQGSVPLYTIMESIHSDRTETIESKIQYIQSIWEIVSENSLYIFNKLITAGYRSPVSKKEIDHITGPEDTLSPPLRTIKAVLLYISQTEYTFAVWKNDLLIPVVKTTRGMQQEDHLHIRKFVATNTRERFGPVYSINPELVFEIGFEAVERASRRISGVKLISPRIMKRCHNAGLDDIDRVEVLHSMMDS
jgi:hypothetical protein